MKKTVVFDFPDDFKFPEFWGSEICIGCPFNTYFDDEPMCFLTQDDGTGYRYDTTVKAIVNVGHPVCPFYGGAETVNYDDC